MALATGERRESGFVYDSDGRQVVKTTASTTSTAGNIRKVTVTAGTAVKLNATSLPIKRATVCALSTNTGVVVVGGASVVAAVGTRNSAYLSAGDSRDLGAVDLTDMWLDSTVNAEGVTVDYEA